MKNNLLLTIIVSVIVGGIGFFAGMQYQKSQRPNVQGGQFRSGMMGQGRNNFQGVRPVTGEIISADDKSITVKMQDESTKIIILSDKTTINKASKGSRSDLKVGERIAVFGTENSGGSVTAQNISIGGELFRQGIRNNPSPAN